MRCEWGEQGVRDLSPFVDAVIVVDVLSFTTCVDVAVSRGASLLPYRWKDDSIFAFAEQHGAIAASRGRRFSDGFSLSPTSLLELKAGMKLVLPSPNGATLCAIAQELLPGHVFAACLRNAAAIGQFVGQQFERVLVVPAGERWPDSSIRPAIEDLIGAGAVIAAMQGCLSPEAEIARQVFESSAPHLAHIISQCSSGRELIERGFEVDVNLACELNVSTCVPQLRDGIFGRAS